MPFQTKKSFSLVSKKVYGILFVLVLFFYVLFYIALLCRLVFSSLSCFDRSGERIHDTYITLTHFLG